MSTEDYIQGIIAIEWEMFDLVENEGGRASCQNDYRTFAIMRSSQYRCWNEMMLASYYEDLKQAKAAGRNLLSEKYARMMASTHPDEYQKIKEQLPEITADTWEKIEKITQANVEWKREMESKYPKLAGHGRPLTSAEDTPWATSFETYMRGETATYSARTIELYAEYVEQCQREGINLAERNLEEMTEQYGYQSLEQAENALR